MAKQKPITGKVIKEEKVIEVITEKVIEPIIETELIKEETATVVGIASAEKYQKSGWQLIDCHLTPEGKEYKFRKVI